MIAVSRSSRPCARTWIRAILRSGSGADGQNARRGFCRRCRIGRRRDLGERWHHGRRDPGRLRRGGAPGGNRIDASSRSTARTGWAWLARAGARHAPPARPGRRSPRPPCHDRRRTPTEPSPTPPARGKHPARRHQARPAPGGRSQPDQAECDRPEHGPEDEPDYPGAIHAAGTGPTRARSRRPSTVPGRWAVCGFQRPPYQKGARLPPWMASRPSLPEGRRARSTTYGRSELMDGAWRQPVCGVATHL